MCAIRKCTDRRAFADGGRAPTVAAPPAFFAFAGTTFFAGTAVCEAAAEFSSRRPLSGCFCFLGADSSAASPPLHTADSAGEALSTAGGIADKHMGACACMCARTREVGLTQTDRCSLRLHRAGACCCNTKESKKHRMSFCNRYYTYTLTADAMLLTPLLCVPSFSASWVWVRASETWV